MKNALFDSKFRIKIETARQKWIERKNDQSNDNKLENLSSTKNASSSVTSASITSKTVSFVTFATFREISTFSIEFYSFLNFWILNKKSDVHVCNKTMINRFRKTRDENSSLLTEDSKLEIEAYDEIDIILNDSNDSKWLIKLINVAYILRFMINIVAQKILKTKH